MYLIYTFISSFYFAWPIFIAYVSSRFGLAAVGVYFTTISLSALLFEVPTGYVADRYGRRLSVILGISMKIIGIGILVLGTSTVALVLNAVLYGAGLALISGAIDALLYQSVTHKEYEVTTSMSVPFYQFGLILSALLGGYFYEINIHLPVIAEAILACVMIMPVLLMQKDTHKAKGELTFKEAFSSLKQIFTVRASLIFLIAFLVYATVLNLFLEIILERKMIELMISPSQRGTIIAFVKIFAIFIVQSVIIGKLQSVRTKAIFAFISGIVSFGLLGFVKGSILFVLVYFMTNPFTMLFDAVLSPIKQKLSNHDTRATDISMYSLLARLAFAATAPIAGWYLTGHSTAGIFISCTIALSVAFPFLLKTLNWYEKS